MSYPPPPSPYYYPATPPARRRHGWLIALVATVVVVALVATGAWLAFRGGKPEASPTPRPTTAATTSAAGPSVPPCDEQREDPQTGPNSGDASAGDPYLCWAGGAGYDAVSYDVKVSVEPDTAQITGHADVVVRLTGDVDAVHLDLVLPASAVTVDGRPVQFEQDRLDLAVPTDAAVGDEVTIGVDYAGVPRLTSDMGSAVRHRGAEILLADEPAGAVTWVPINAHPSDPAMFRAAVSVPRGVEAISVGRLLSNGPDPAAPGRDLWVWAPDEPVIGYTVMLAVGQYVLDGPRDVTVGGRTVQYLAAASESQPDPQQTLDWLARSVEAADALTTFAGEYPFSSLGGLVPPMSTGWALETHGRPVYDSGFIGHQDSVLTHELAHFWFGDTVTLAQEDDIVTKEGLATYCEYQADITGSSPTPGQFLDEVYEGYPRSFWDQALSDPGPGLDAFSTKVYDGGAAALQALRNRMGDEAFLAFVKAWAAQRGPHSLEEFRAMAQEYSPTDVSGLLAAWFDGRQRPARTAENGLDG